MTRQQAEKAYKQALSEARIAEDVSEAAFSAAEATLTAARKHLVQTEMANPTSKEMRRDTEILRLRNRGLDV